MAVIQLRKGWEPKIWVSDRALKISGFSSEHHRNKTQKTRVKTWTDFFPPALSFPRDKQMADKHEMSGITGSQGNTDQDTSSRPAGMVMSDNNKG